MNDSSSFYVNNSENLFFFQCLNLQLINFTLDILLPIICNNIIKNIIYKNKRNNIKLFSHYSVIN